MDDLLQEFLTETGESLERVDAELVRFEQDPNNGQILGNIFRLVHTIKGTCGFLGLPRLERLAHAAENLMGKFRDGMPVTAEAVTLVLSTIDRIKAILEAIEAEESEPAGDDVDLIEQLAAFSQARRCKAAIATSRRRARQAQAGAGCARIEEAAASDDSLLEPQTTEKSSADKRRGRTARR